MQDEWLYSNIIYSLPLQKSEKIIFAYIREITLIVFDIMTSVDSNVSTEIMLIIMLVLIDLIQFSP